MKSLANSADTVEILRRLDAIGPTSRRRWGRMTVAEMICHSSDALRIAMGEKNAKSISTWFSRTVMKWGGLFSPTKWPHGVQTVPECKAGAGGTPPAEIEADLQELRELVGQFARIQKGFAFPEHALFGRMSHTEWMRWGYLHLDHHLRQFGA
jgi:Protein of unknown function (DUF1569)